VGVFADVHACAEALDAVLTAASGCDELWSLGDMVGGGPDPALVVAGVRSACRVALLGNHDYLLWRDGEVHPSIAHARAVLDADALAWLRARKPASRRGELVQMWHGGPHNAVHEFVGPRNAAACLERLRAPIGLVGHTHVAAAFSSASRRPVRVAVDVPLELGSARWLLNPGAVGDPGGVASWLELDLEARVAVWRSAPFDPEPAAARVRRLGWEP
jgi:predicted phosphodiesterase